MELPADEFGDVLLPRFREDASALHQVGFELAVTSALDIDELGSPSHAIRVKRDSGTLARAVLAAEKDIPNRDLVLDAHYGAAKPQVIAGRAKDGKGRFAAVIPSTSFGERGESPRRLVILLDRSGSMQGAPLSQAVKAIDACLAALSEGDWFGLVAFDDRAESCCGTLLAGTRESRDRAHRFLETITARGGTQLVRGFQSAAELMGSEGGDVLIFTDGQVAGTEQILAAARQSGTRLHCLGIGSASQDRFLALLARETGGNSRFVTPRERVDMPAVDLFASIGRPVASGLKVHGNVDPEPSASVHAGTPVLLFGEAADGDAIELVWDGGSLRVPVHYAGDETGEAAWLLQGARLITDWECRYPSAEALASREKRQANRVAARLRELSQTYGLASREMSLVAVVKRAGDRAGQLPEIGVVPVGMPQDTSFGAYFGRPVSANFLAAPLGGPVAGSPSACDMVPPVSSSRKRFALFEAYGGDVEPPPAMADTPNDTLLLLASAMEPDGGLPGPNTEARAAATVIALLAFLANGHTPVRGAFRAHVVRLVTFLETVPGLDAAKRKLVDLALVAARKGRAPSGDWLRWTQSAARHWSTIEKAFVG